MTAVETWTHPQDGTAIIRPRGPDPGLSSLGARRSAVGESSVEPEPPNPRTANPRPLCYPPRYPCGRSSFPAPGRPRSLEVRDGSRSFVPGSGSRAMIRVRATGVNFADVMARVGLYPDAPKPPLRRRLRGRRDGGGASARGYSGLAPRPAGGRAHTLRRLRGGGGGPRPAGVSPPRGGMSFFEEGAAVPVNYLTAVLMLPRYFGNGARRATRCWSTPPRAASAWPRSSSASSAGAEVLGTASASKHAQLQAVWACSTRSTTARRTAKAEVRRTRADGVSTSSSMQPAAISRKSYLLSRPARTARSASGSRGAAHEHGRRSRLAGAARAWLANAALRSDVADQPQSRRVRAARRAPVERAPPASRRSWRC